MYKLYLFVYVESMEYVRTSRVLVFKRNIRDATISAAPGATAVVVVQQVVVVRQQFFLW